MTEYHHHTIHNLLHSGAVTMLDYPSDDNDSVLIEVLSGDDQLAESIETVQQNERIQSVCADPAIKCTLYWKGVLLVSRSMCSQVDFLC